jgi:hypothetical protein
VRSDEEVKRSKIDTADLQSRSRAGAARQDNEIDNANYPAFRGRRGAAVRWNAIGGADS